MATIKAIESRSVHLIQSGQVIVDLCSVVKELVENSLDAGATAIDVRFKSNGLNSIEVQDNGVGIAPADYKTIALKHYTSKLSSFEDLTALNTFGFRGEALSSLCALSNFCIITAREDEAPKGTRLEFQLSGVLKGTSVAACQRGTTVISEDLFHNLPVRRKELEKNIKREYSKVQSLLHAYACIQTGVKLSVSNQVAKGKKSVVFATNNNSTTRENISNVYGAKAVSALIPLDLRLELQSAVSQAVASSSQDDLSYTQQVHILGHVSRPVFGEGRQTPDRQMFFVNSRPCLLPQFAKAFNEVYKSYNITQSPFVFANLILDTNAYDVNVSPDKRSILLHEQNALLDSLKVHLTKLFDSQEQTVPQSQLSPFQKLPSFQPLTITRGDSIHPSKDPPQQLAIQVERMKASKISQIDSELTSRSDENSIGVMPKPFAEKDSAFLELDPKDSVRDRKTRASVEPDASIEFPFSSSPKSRITKDFNDRVASQKAKQSDDFSDEEGETEVRAFTASNFVKPTRQGLIEDAFPRARFRRLSDNTSVSSDNHESSMADSHPVQKRRKVKISSPPVSRSDLPRPSSFVTALSAFKADSSSRSSRHEALLPGEAAPASEDPVVENARGGQKHDIATIPSNTNVSLNDKISNSTDDDESDKDHQLGQPAVADDERLSDDDYVDETQHKLEAEAKIQELIVQAEKLFARPSKENKKRVASLLKSSISKDMTLNLMSAVEISTNLIENQSRRLCLQFSKSAENKENDTNRAFDGLSQSKTSAEERLSLTISKSDFAEMRVVGQFNLGFILATRSSTTQIPDDLFIIDQHASDEIYNFSRLSNTTTLSPQPLVRPHPLELTAIEEEIIVEHATTTLAKNGFQVSMDTSGKRPVGRRCHLLTLPTSRETVFDPRDLEELLALLADAPAPSAREGETEYDRPVIRPSKVRKMLAMRACRSSIMVGHTLSTGGMKTVLRHMGEIDRPWNCPHGRPTMRHLVGLSEWEGWFEGEGLADTEDLTSQALDNESQPCDWPTFGIGKVDWVSYAKKNRMSAAEEAVVPVEDAGTESENDHTGEDDDEDHEVEFDEQLE